MSYSIFFVLLPVVTCFTSSLSCYIFYILLRYFFIFIFFPVVMAGFIFLRLLCLVTSFTLSCFVFYVLLSLLYLVTSFTSSCYILYVVFISFPPVFYIVIILLCPVCVTCTDGYTKESSFLFVIVSSV